MIAAVRAPSLSPQRHKLCFFCLFGVTGRRCGRSRRARRNRNRCARRAFASSGHGASDTRSGTPCCDHTRRCEPRRRKRMRARAPRVLQAQGGVARLGLLQGALAEEAAAPALRGDGPVPPLHAGAPRRAIAPRGPIPEGAVHARLARHLRGTNPAAGGGCAHKANACGHRRVALWRVFRGRARPRLQRFRARALCSSLGSRTWVHTCFVALRLYCAMRSDRLRVATLLVPPTSSAHTRDPSSSVRRRPLLAGASALQTLCSMDAPVPAWPHSFASTLTVRDRHVCPPAQVAEHGSHAPQSAHSPSTQSFSWHLWRLQPSICDLSWASQGLQPGSGETRMCRDLARRAAPTPPAARPTPPRTTRAPATRGTDPEVAWAPHRPTTRPARPLPAISLSLSALRLALRFAAASLQRRSPATWPPTMLKGTLLCRARRRRRGNARTVLAKLLRRLGLWADTAEVLRTYPQVVGAQGIPPRCLPPSPTELEALSMSVQRPARHFMGTLGASRSRLHALWEYISSASL